MNLAWPQMLELIALIVLMIGVPAWALRRRFRGGLESGASLGRFEPDDAQEYGATIAHPGQPPEHVTVLSTSLREAKRALEAAYGKANVSDVRSENDSPAL